MNQWNSEPPGDPPHQASNLVARLYEYARSEMVLASVVSNTGKPESDNDYGRRATAMREAADEIERLEAECDRYKAALRYIASPFPPTPGAFDRSPAAVAREALGRDSGA